MEFYGTLGPACCSKEILKKMIQAGMTGIRLNLSHKSLRESEEWIHQYFEAAESEGVSPGFMIDLMGPELRIGDLAEELFLEEGDMVILGEKQIPVPEIILPFLEEGQPILLDDGKIELKAQGRNQKGKCQIVRGGCLTSKKSIAFPGCFIDTSTLTKQDIENLSYASQYHVTDVMLPFVRGKQDLMNLKKALKETNNDDVRIFAKIENMQGVLNVEQMIPYCDSIVIARGDLGNAMPMFKLPCIQNDIAKQCREKDREFLVVTQMLNSMIDHPYPTRAEVNDIFQAVMQGASAIMLTGETAAGKYPVEAMKMFVQTGLEAQNYKQKL